MLQYIEFSDRVQSLSDEELSSVISKCEVAIENGSAEIEDYEAFVLCQQELAKRTWA